MKTLTLPGISCTHHTSAFRRSSRSSFLRGVLSPSSSADIPLLRTFSAHPLPDPPSCSSSVRTMVAACRSSGVSGAKGVDGSRPSEPLARGIPGEIHVIIGPMFAGKTTALLRRIQAERDNGRSGSISLSFALLSSLLLLLGGMGRPSMRPARVKIKGKKKIGSPSAESRM